MRCQQIEEKLNDYLEGYLNPPEAEAIEKHLQQCSNCRQLFLALQEVRLSLQKMPQITIPPSLVENLYQIPATQKRRRFSWHRLLSHPLPQQLTAALASLLLAISFYSLMPNRQALVNYLNQQFHLGYHRISRLVTKAEYLTVNLEKVGDSLKIPIQSLKEEKPKD